MPPKFIVRQPERDISLLVISPDPSPENKETVNIERVLRSHGAETYAVSFEVAGHQLIEEADGIVLGPSGKTQKGQAEKKAWSKQVATLMGIEDMDVPILGICAGHQILGRLNGAQTYRSPESGIYSISLLETDPLIQGYKDMLSVRENHGLGVHLPENYTQLGIGNDTPNQIMKANDRPHYGVQFHPEEYNPTLLKNFMNIVRQHKNYKSSSISGRA